MEFISCLTASDCEPVNGARVSVFGQSGYVSNVTAISAPGSYTLRVPLETVRLFVETPDSARYLPTLQAKTLQIDRDTTGVDVYVIDGKGSLYTSIVGELGVAVETDGIYIGQVIQNAGPLKAVAGASVVVSPTAPLRFIKTNFDLDPTATEAFYSPSQQTTGVFGQFVVHAPATAQDYSITPELAGQQFPTLQPSLAAGHITFGIHQGQP